MDNGVNVSVIFATYNRGSIIRDVIECWKKVDKVTKYTYEIICSDDASNDNTVELLREVEGLPIKVLCNEHGGASKARNKALEIASGELVIFTGDDIFPCEEYINMHFENYLKYGSKVATLGLIEWHPKLQVNHLMHHITAIGCEQFSFVGMLPYQYIDFRHFYTSNISIAKSELDQLECYFDMTFDRYGFEDVELGYRLEQNGVKILYNPDINAYHHHSYNSLEKFCNRQKSAGNQLVVLSQLHPELADRCGIDVKNMESCAKEYLATKRGKFSIHGMVIKGLINITKINALILEKLIRNIDKHKIRAIVSAIYCELFRFYTFYGCASRVAEKLNISNSKVFDFVMKYIYRSYSQIFIDTGSDFNEAESYKWFHTGSTPINISFDITNAKSIRFDPLDKKCKVSMVEVYVIDNKGNKKKIEFDSTNAVKVKNGFYDFSKVDDSQMFISKLPKNSKRIVIKMNIKILKKALYSKRIIRTIGGFLLSGRDMKKVRYQPRKIQLCIDTSKVGYAIVDKYKKATYFFGEFVIVSDLKNSKDGYVNYVYAPEVNCLDEMQIVESLYCLLKSNYDYLVISNTLDVYPIIGSDCIEDSLIYSQSINGDVIESIKNNIALSGRILRLPNLDKEVKCITCEKIFGNKRVVNDSVLLSINTEIPKFHKGEIDFRYEKRKPVVFVFPIFMAVGGVERNTIEIMRALQDDFSFCVITMERHSKEQGSLHNQLYDLCDNIYDLKEIVEFDNYLSTLEELNRIYQPDLVWICNSSPWFQDNSLSIRQLYQEVPIVLQDAYDTEYGWITYYNTPGVQSYDRYIAINQKIRETFVNKYKISNEKIDVIYSAVDSIKIEEAKKNDKSKNTILNEYGLNPNKKYFAYIGRLTDQKNPLRYLKMVNGIVKKYNEIEFLIVGDGVLGNSVDEYILQNNLGNRLHRIPYVANTPELFKALDGLIMTSNYEGLAIVSIEAMSIGVPILSTDTGDLKLFLDKTRGGLIMHKGEENDIDNFNILFENLDNYKQNAVKSSDEILNFFSSSNVAEQYRDTFKKSMLAYKQ